MHYQQFGVFGFGQVAHGFGVGHLGFGKPGFVDVEVDVAVVYGHYAAVSAAVSTTGFAAAFIAAFAAIVHADNAFALHGGSRVGFNDACCTHARHEGVVYAKSYVSQWLGFGQNQFIDHFACATCFDDVEFDVVLGFKLG